MSEATTKLPVGDGAGPDTLSRQKEVHVGTILWERYEVSAVLGSGDLGDLWRCFDRDENRHVALRELPPALRRSKAVLASIHDGIQKFSEHTHPNVASIRQLIYIGENIYLLGDYAPGADLETWRGQGEGGGRMFGEAMAVLRQVAAALDFAHSHGIIHRNLKPSNVFIDKNGVARVTEFGLAPHGHLTLIHGEAVRTGTTGPYLAPELAKGGAPDSASDQYALAVLAWQLFAGVPPEESGPGAFPESIAQTARPALTRALSPNPRKRFVTCSDFVKALGGEKVGGHRGRSAKEWKRIGARVGIAAGGVALAAGLCMAGRALVAWLDRTEAVPEVGPEAGTSGAAAAAPAWTPPVRMQATTPLPVRGQAWVAHTVPMELIWVPPLQMWVGRYEVTNEEYRRKEPDHNSGDYEGVCLNGDRQPVVRVNFEDTMAYVRWLTEQERAAGKLPEDLVYRLPTRREAIAYTRAGMEYTYPWGEVWPPVRGNYADAAMGAAFPESPSIPEYQDGFAVTAPVERSGENAWGLFGAGGNVWETTSRASDRSQFGGWQGGGWEDHQPDRIRCEALYGFLGNARGAVNGLRVVLAPVDPAETPNGTNSPAPAP